MDIDKFERILSACRANGVIRFKEDDLEIEFGAVVAAQTPAVERQSAPAVTLEDVAPSEVVIPHHMSQVTSLLRLSDNDLVEKLFPDYSQDTHGAVNGN